MDNKAAAIAAVVAYLGIEAEERAAAFRPAIQTVSTWRLLGRIGQLQARTNPAARHRTGRGGRLDTNAAAVRRSQPL